MIHNPADLSPILDLLGDFEDIEETLAAISEKILEDTGAIREVTDSEAILTETSGQLTTDGNVQNLYIAEAPAGIFRPICVKIDFTNHTAAETVVIKTHYRIALGGAHIEQDTATYAGVVSPELINIDLDPNRYGIKVTIQKTAGTNRAYDWEVFYEEAP